MNIVHANFEHCATNNKTYVREEFNSLSYQVQVTYQIQYHVSNR